MKADSIGTRAAFLAGLIVLALGLRDARASEEPGSSASAAPCSISKATLGELGQATPEISTEEMAQAVSGGKALILDARPFMEYAVSHIPGAVNVAPKPGLPMSQYTSDVAEIDRITRGGKDRLIVLYCNGPYCGKSRRLAADLVAAGYADVRRYQLGIPVWRALGHVTQIEVQGVRLVMSEDQTAVLVDGRSAEEYRKGSLAGARNVPLAEVAKAKDDGRLPMTDHNTRILVIARGEAGARTVAEEIAKNAFHNVSFFAGSIDTLAHSHEQQHAPGPR